MSSEQIGLAFIIIAITLISGLADSQGFVHAANIWQDDKLIWSELGKSALGFGVGILMYWFALKYLKAFGIISPEIQTIVWFGVTIVGVAIFSGNFSRWHSMDQIVALLVLAGMGWLLFRTGG